MTFTDYFVSAYCSKIGMHRGYAAHIVVQRTNAYLIAEEELAAMKKSRTSEEILDFICKYIEYKREGFMQLVRHLT